jgi:hypothetical protein
VATTQLFPIVGWSANASAIATIITFVTAILFFSVGKPWGKINDISSVFQVLFMLPLALGLYLLLRPHAPAVSLVATVIGIGGMLLVAVGQSLLVFGAITFEQSLKFFPAGGAIGVWLVLVGYLALSSGLLPQGLAWVGALAGAGYMVTVVGFLLGGQEHAVFYVGGLVLAISYPVWAIWFGHLLLSAGVPGLRAA